MISKRAIEDLEFDKVLDMVRRYSLSDIGRAGISAAKISHDEAVLTERADRISCILSKLEAGEVSLSPFVSLTPLFEAVERHESCFDGRDLTLASSFVSSLKLLAAFEDNPSLCPQELKDLARELDSALNPDGSVRDDHPLMRPLFKALEGERSRRQEYTSQILSSQGRLFQSGEAVYRNERVVLPVKREMRGAFDGYVQGASASGGTLYIEPFQLVEMNNRVTLAEDAIMRMRHQVLSQLSAATRKVAPLLEEAEAYLADFDFHYSFAHFIRKMKCQRAIFSNKLDLKGARHPLLFEKAVPVSLSVDEGVRVVVLSGANAGGKTVTMKTAALMVLLAETCGYAPFDEGSSLPLFKSIHTDIGDGQSILENFSTFSSHMSNVARICREADADSLVLLDEIGSGTDPAEGAALVDSLLDYFKQKGSMLFVTSHYSTVKLHAYDDDGMMNASMEFDESTSRPTFRVIPGLPGDSHAIAIAKRMGLPQSVINSAKESLGTSSTVSQLIASLNGKTRALDRKVTQLSLEQKRLERMEAELEKEKKETQELRQRLQEGSADELRKWMKDTRRRLEKLVADLSKKGTIDKKDTKAVKDFIKEIGDKSAEADKEVEQVKEERWEAEDIEYKVGDEVFCGSYGRRGVITRDLGKGRYQVSIDSMRITLTRDDIRPAPAEKGAQVSTYKITSSKPQVTLYLRGKTLEEALNAVADQIEACLVHSVSTFSIIHGYGNGILSQGIHRYLKSQRDVKDYYFANPEDGGMGKTYVELG